MLIICVLYVEIGCDEYVVELFRLGFDRLIESAKIIQTILRIFRQNP